MPWVKLGNGKYKSPSGKVMTLPQIKAYEAKKKAGGKK